jgi:hypothetical protein
MALCITDNKSVTLISVFMAYLRAHTYTTWKNTVFRETGKVSEVISYIKYEEGMVSAAI